MMKYQGDQNDQESPPDNSLTPVDRRYFEMVRREGQAWTAAAEGGQWTSADQIPAAEEEGQWTAADQVASESCSRSQTVSHCFFFRPSHLAVHLFHVLYIYAMLLISLVCRKEEGLGKTWQESKMR